jgi:hypothetical protein
VLNTHTCAWCQLSGSGPAPAARSTHTAVRVGSKLLVLGGQGVHATPLNDVWQLHGYDAALAGEGGGGGVQVPPLRWTRLHAAGRCVRRGLPRDNDEAEAEGGCRSCWFAATLVGSAMVRWRESERERSRMTLGSRSKHTVAVVPPKYSEFLIIPSARQLHSLSLSLGRLRGRARQENGP